MTVDQGKAHIDEIVREHAQREGIPIDRLTWSLDDGAPPLYTLTVESGQGSARRIADQRFREQHLTSYINNNQIMIEIMQKVEGIMVHLKPRAKT